jgi:hypothetical protein
MVVSSNPSVPISAAGVAAAVLDAASGDHVDAGTVGERLERLDMIASGGAGQLTTARIAKLDNADASIQTLDTVADAIKAVTDALPDSGALTSVKPLRAKNPGHYLAPPTGARIAPQSAAGAHTLGAYVEAEDSIPADSLLVGFGFEEVPSQETNVVVDIAVGAGGSEVSIGEVPLGGVSASIDGGLYNITPPLEVASGERLSAAIRDGSGSAHAYGIMFMLIRESNLEAYDA